MSGVEVLAFATAVKVYSDVQEGKAQARQMREQARIDEQNAAISRQNAEADEKRFRRIGRKDIGSMRAQVAASGITLDGSALDAMVDSAMEIELDALTIRYQGEIEALGYKTEAGAYRTGAREARQAGYTRAAADVVMAPVYARAYR